MFTSKFVPHLNLLRGLSRALQAHGEIFNGCVLPLLPAHYSLLNQRLRNYSTAAGNTSPPRWVRLEPELDEALVPLKLSVSPLEIWLSLRFSLPPLLESVQPQEDTGPIKETVLPPISVPVVEDGDGSATPLLCKNVLEIRRRKTNKHNHRKLQKRTKFLRKRVLASRGKRKQKRFEKELKRIWRRAGLKKAPEGWHVPKIFVKLYGNKSR